MCMSRKNYIALAKIISASRLDKECCLKSLEELTDKLCDYLNSDNPRFNSDRFKKACGLE